jgi:predicted enzyme related to lactoylglutathione lyase
VQKLGGSVIMPTTHFDIGDMAVVRDPQGAVFSLIQFAEAPASS